MLKKFQCPTCAAPLVFEGKMLIDCTYCDGTIIAPADIADKDEIEHKRKLETANSIVKSIVSATGAKWKGGSWVIDLRSDSRKAQQNLGSVATEIQKGHSQNAVNLFTQTFGVGSKDAEQIVDAIGHGKAFDTKPLRLYPEAPISTRSEFGWLIKLVIFGVIGIFVLPLLVTAIIVLMIVLRG